MHIEALGRYRTKLLRPKEATPEIDYVLFVIVDREHVKMLDESLFHGTFYHPKHRWEYYEAFNS